MDFEKILQENHGKEVLIFTKDEHHYQGQLVGCQCKVPYTCSHLIVLLFGINYVDVAVDDITEIKIMEENPLS